MTDDRIVNMANQVRPRDFSSMVGQPFAKGLGERLGKGVVSGQGYIIAGPKGCGKTSLARIIAKSLNCPNRSEETGDPCNECDSCRLADSGGHPLIEEINSAANRGINEIKERLSSINLSISNGYRVYILDEAHLLTRDAFSALLKPMEEPPEHVIFILTTTNPEKIIDTIISRSPIISVGSLTDDELRTVLEHTIEVGKTEDPELWGKITEADIEESIMSATGSARQAITRLSGIVFHGVSADEGTTKNFKGLAAALISGNTAAVLSQATTILSDKTVDPVGMITSVVEIIVRNIAADNVPSPALAARCVADLSQVSSEIVSGTPAVMVAARVTSCTPKIPAQRRAPQKRGGGASPGNVLDARNATLEQITERLFSPEGSRILGQWTELLNDPWQANMRIEEGVFVVRVAPNPGRKRELGERLRKIVQPVAVDNL